MVTRRLSPRYREIARILRRHGLGFAASATRMDWLIPFHRGAFSHEVRPEPYRTPEHVRLLLEQLGPTFIKLGQLLSTRPDLIPADYIDELAKLQDDAPPVDAEIVRGMIRSELGQSPDDLFRDFDSRPLASASIGQAHAAVLQDGTEVVVKVRRPGAAVQVEEDLAILLDLAERSERHSESARTVGLRSLVEEFASSIRTELDYVTEAQNAERFAANFASNADVGIPRVFWEHTTRTILTLERVRGIKISDIAALDAAHVDRPALAQRATGVLLKMIFEDRFFHADPHPGNMFVSADGRIELIDFGMVGELSERLQERLTRLFIALMDEDADELADALIELSVTSRGVERAELVDSAGSLIIRYHGRTLGDLDVGGLLSDLFSMVRAHGIRLPSELAMLLKVLLMAEGVGVRLDPTFQMAGVLAPYAEQLSRRATSIAAIARRLAATGGDAGELLLRLPRGLQRLLDGATSSGVVVQVRVADLEPILGRAERIGNQLLAGLLAAAFIRGIGEVVTHDRKWRPWEGGMMAAGLSVISGLSGYLLWSARRRHR